MDSRIKALFERYFAGKHTPEEEKEIFRLMHSGKFDDELKDAIAGTDWDSAQFSTSSEEQLRRLDKLYDRLSKETAQERRPGKKRDLPYFMKFAAVFAGLLMLAAGAYYTFYNKGLQTIKTAYGEVREVRLSDGSVVTLNANSLLKFKPSWEAMADREVWLEGEAYFSVSHKRNDQKFVVYSDDLDIEVIGTEFNVNNRRTNNQVVLRSGKIKITPAEAAGKSVIMKPGDLLELGENDSLIVEKVETGYFSAWKDARMLFERTPLFKIARMIEDNYGFKVTIENKKLAALTYTADIPSNKLDVLLETLSESYNMEIEKTKKEIVFKQ